MTEIITSIAFLCQAYKEDYIMKCQKRMLQCVLDKGGTSNNKSLSECILEGKVKR